MFYVYRCTTDKINDAFQRIAEAGDEAQMPLYWLGGRDWLIVARKGRLGVEEQTPDLRVLAGHPDRKNYSGGAKAGVRDGVKDATR